MKVYRSSSGAVINIGEWDYMTYYDENEILIINNPLPAGATQSEEEIEIGWDGGLYVKGDPRARND